MAHAGESSFPFTTSNLATEEQWARFNRALGHQEGVVNSTLDHNAPDLQVTPGTAGTVTISAGEAAINGFYYRASQAITLPIPTNASGATARNDTVVLEANQSTNEVTMKYLGGGAGSPTLTRVINGVWQMPIAAVQVPARATSVAATNITDRRQFVMYQGIVMGDGDQKPIGKLGQLLYTPGKLWVYAAAGWTQVWPITIQTNTVGAFTRISTGPGFTANWKEHSATEYSRPAYAKFPDGWVTLRGVLQTKVKTGNDEVMFRLPTGYRPGATQIFDIASSGDRARVDVEADGQVRCWGIMEKDDYVSLNGVSFVAES